MCASWLSILLRPIQKYTHSNDCNGLGHIILKRNSNHVDKFCTSSAYENPSEAMAQNVNVIALGRLLGATLFQPRRDPAAVFIRLDLDSLDIGASCRGVFVIEGLLSLQKAARIFSHHPCIGVSCLVEVNVSHPGGLCVFFQIVGECS